MNPARDTQGRSLRGLQEMAAGRHMKGKGAMASTRPLSISVFPLNVSFKYCQWIEGDPGPDDSCKCLAPTEPNPHRAPYCAAHLARAYPESTQ